MRLSWNEIRIRAAQFAADWKDQGYEKGQTQLFYQELFQVFGMPVRKVAAFEEPVKDLGDKRGFIDLFWRGVLLVEQKSIGRDLKKAKRQALDYFPGLKDADLPRYLLVSDFQTFELYDLDEVDEAKFSLKDLPRHVEKFGFILGVQKRSFQDQDPVNIKAAELVGSIHDALEESGFRGHDLEQFLVRLVFCLFADDTGIFEPREIFLDLLKNRTSEDGSDLGGWLANLFQVLDTPEAIRVNTLDEDLGRFPYINGDLFRDVLKIPSFNTDIRSRLLKASEFDWSSVSPAIFGSLFQSVMEPAERRAQGAHYTTERNILKVIEPLFLDDLRAEFERIRGRKDNRRKVELEAFQKRLSKLRFMDPACGCGNFLIITYRELRALEIAVIRELRTAPDSVQLEQDVAILSLVDVDQFYGIEINEFPARIAETALWMMDHIMNSRLSLEFGQSYLRIPLKKSPHIVHADALATNWASVLAPRDCSYLLGNPPFIGAKFQSIEQRERVRQLASLGGSGGSLDFVAAWFIKAGAYFSGKGARIGLVATNSITQGEQVAQLWPILFERYKLTISFAHRTFAWGSDAPGKAQVHVVIIGLCTSDHSPAEKRLFHYDGVTGEAHESRVASLSPYLFDAAHLANPNLVVDEAAAPLNGLPKISSGSQPIDGGHLIFSADEKRDFLVEEPLAERFMRPFVGAQEFLKREERWILSLQNASPDDLKEMPKVVERLRRVRAFREQSQRKSTRKLASFPTRFNVEVIPDTPFLAIPEVSSERREYIPLAWLSPPVIPSNKIRILRSAKLWQFALLTSAMHMSWVRHIGGRLKSDFQYSIGIDYNTFPVPAVSASDVAELDDHASTVLSARAAYPISSLADLYDPDLMPPTLKKAHQALDERVDRLYRRAKFVSDRERAEHLLGLYESLVSPLLLAQAAKSRPRRKGR